MQLEIPMATRTVRSVSEITDLLQSLIEQQPHLQNVWVQGQISNYSRSSAGHIYFTLKDEKSQIQVVIPSREQCQPPSVFADVMAKKYLHKERLESMALHGTISD